MSSVGRDKSVGEAVRIGVFGGTFDPIHVTHLDIARAALLFVVSGSPPHKNGEVFATPEQRLRMVEAALEGEEAMEASSLELRRGGPSYMADTLDELRKAHPGGTLFLILGLDSLSDLPNWRTPGRILRQAEVLAVARPGTPSEVGDLPAQHYTRVPFKENGLSSTEVRARLKRGDAVAELLPPAVARLIREERIYHAGR